MKTHAYIKVETNHTLLFNIVIFIAGQDSNPRSI